MDGTSFWGNGVNAAFGVKDTLLKQVLGLEIRLNIS